MSASNITEPPPIIGLDARPDLFSFISDGYIALAAPVVAYWSYGLFFYLLDINNCFVKYRLHTPKEISQQNQCTMSEVIRAVVLQHIVQTLAGLVLMQIEPPQYTGYEEYELWKLQANLGVSHNIAWFIYYILVPGFRIFFGCVIMDTWQYALHRTMHMNTWLYKRFHSVHHRLYVPFAFGALYNSLVEGLLLDTVGAGLSYALTGMSTRESIIFYTFSTLKTVDDHCGYQLPWDPFQILFPNNAAYHDIHHQRFGIKTNFSQPFFIHWDELLGTRYKGTKSYIAKQKQIRESEYEKVQSRKTN